MNHNITISWKLKPLFPNKKQPSIEYEKGGKSTEFPITIRLWFESQDSALTLEDTQFYCNPNSENVHRLDLVCR
jgi:hypothetical protein